MKWRISFKCLRRTELKNRGPDFLEMPDLQKTALPSDQGTSAKSLPILKPMTLLFELCLDVPLFVLLAHKYSHPKPSPDSLGLAIACVFQLAIPLLFPSKLGFW